jgi:hypothetical protein
MDIALAGGLKVKLKRITIVPTLENVWSAGAWRSVLGHATRERAWGQRAHLVQPDIGMSWERAADIDALMPELADHGFPLLIFPPWRIDVLLLKPAAVEQMSSSVFDEQVAVRFFADISTVAMPIVIESALKHTPWESLDFRTRIDRNSEA